MSIYDTLNSEQKKAVLNTDGPVLILAGAGSGKTRVLTHRVAYLIDECNVNPWNIMAITFTNKAAGEMRDRVDKIVGFGSESIWVSTFHSTCVRILRRYADRIGYDTNFTIYDSDDSKSLMKDICKTYQLETVQLKMRRIMNVISTCKDNLVTPTEYSLSTQNDHIKMKIAKAYQEYQAGLKKNNAMDFDDLIMKTVELFKTNPDVLDSYQERFKYIMVDEYQDTNNAQFELIRLLADKYKNLCVVGDDDQSIYRFRGANIRNILDFEKVYPDAAVIKLEQNYRSTQNILDAANTVIRNNVGRKDKRLWTDEGTGDKVGLRVFDTGYQEAAYIAGDIEKLKKERRADYKEIAVLYRTNAQSRLIEEQFVVKGIPYDLVGGTNFYARREIKDLLCYLKTIDNGRDDLAVRRIINVPKRGIGLTSMGNVQTYANENNISFFEALCEAEKITTVSRGTEKLKDFSTMIRSFRAKQKEMSIEELLKTIIETIKYDEYLKTLDEDDDDKSGDNNRRQNVDELFSKIAAYEENAEEPTLSGFLEEVALVADIDRIEEDDNKVLLMTLHSAKGLEFEHVYMAGLEEGLFPSYMTLEAEDSDPAAMEEERRLCYVGITRAKKNLTITAAKSRMTRGEIQYNPLSRFVKEIPRELIDDQRPEDDEPAFLRGDDGYGSRSSFGKSFEKTTSGYGSGTMISNSAAKSYSSSAPYGGAYSKSTSTSTYGKRPSATVKPVRQRAVAEKPFIAGAASKQKAIMTKGMPSAVIDYAVGDRVSHVKYGEGIVKEMEKGPRDTKVTVEFDECGQKIMYAAVAKLKKL